MNRDFMMMLGNMFGRKDNQGFSQSSMQELAQRLQTEKDFILLDVRTHEEFNEGHIPGAICIPNETIASQTASQLPNKEQLIFVYCHSGMRSMMSANFLASQGYTNVVECGGIMDWQGSLE